MMGSYSGQLRTNSSQIWTIKSCEGFIVVIGFCLVFCWFGLFFVWAFIVVILSVCLGFLNYHSLISSIMLHWRQWEILFLHFRGEYCRENLWSALWSLPPTSREEIVKNVNMNKLHDFQKGKEAEQKKKSKDPSYKKNKNNKNILLPNNQSKTLQP